MADPITMAIIGAGTGAALSPDDPLKGAVLGGFTGGMAGPVAGALGGTAGVGAAAGTAAENAMFMTAPFESLGAGGIAATNGMPTIGTGLSGAVSNMTSPQSMARMGMGMMNQNQNRQMPMAPAAAPRPQMPQGLPPSAPMLSRNREELYPFGGGGLARRMG